MPIAPSHQSATVCSFLWPQFSTLQDRLRMSSMALCAGHRIGQFGNRPQPRRGQPKSPLPAVRASATAAPAIAPGRSPQRMGRWRRHPRMVASEAISGPIGGGKTRSTSCSRASSPSPAVALFGSIGPSSGTSGGEWHPADLFKMRHGVNLFPLFGFRDSALMQPIRKVNGLVYLCRNSPVLAGDSLLRQVSAEFLRTIIVRALAVNDD